MSAFAFLTIALVSQTPLPGSPIHASGPIESAAWSHDGKLIATRVSGRLCMWDAKSGLAVEGADPRGLMSMSMGAPLGFSPDGRWLFASGMLHDPKTAERTRPLEKKDPRAPSLLQMPQEFAFCTDGKKVAVSRENELTLWDVDTGKLLRKMLGHTKRILCIDYSADGKSIVTGSADMTVRVWSAASGKELFSFAGHEEPVCAARFLPDSKTVISADGPAEGGTLLARNWILVWKVGEIKPIRKLDGPLRGTRSLELTPNGEKLLSFGTGDHALRVWSVTTGKALGALTLPAGTAFVKLAPDGRRLLSGGPHPVLRFWDLAKLDPRFEASPQGAEALASTPDGALLATGGKDGVVRLWDPAKSEPVGRIEGVGGEIVSLSFWSDGSRVLTGTRDGDIAVWDVKTSMKALALEKQKAIPSALVLASAGKRIAVAQGKLIRVYDAATGAHQVDLGEHPADILWLAPFDGGRRLGVTLQGESLCTWDLEAASPADSRVFLDGDLKKAFRTARYMKNSRGITFSDDGRMMAFGGGGVGVLRRPTEQAELQLSFTSTDKDTRIDPVVFSPDGRWVASGRSDGQVSLLDLGTMMVVDTFPAQLSRVTGIAFLPGLRLAVSGDDGSLRIWTPDLPPGVHFIGRMIGNLHSFSMSSSGPVESNDEGIRVSDPALPGTPRLMEHSKGFRELAVRSGGTEIVAADPSGNEIVTWNVLTGKGTRTFVTGGGLPLFSQGGKWVVIATAQDWQLWSVDTGVRAGGGRAPAEMHLIALSAEGKHLLTSEPGKLRISEAATGKILRTFDGLQSESPPAINADGSRLAIPYLGDFVDIYDVASGKRLKRLALGMPRGAKVSFQPDGKRLAVLGGSVLQLWDVEAGKRVRAAILRSDRGTHWAWTPDAKGVVVLQSLPDGLMTERVDLVGD